HSLDAAYASAPDAVGVISWNEWSENTYIEPGQRFGNRELDVLRDYLVPSGTRAAAPPHRSLGHPVEWPGVRALGVLVALTALVMLGLLWRPSRRDPVEVSGA